MLLANLAREAGAELAAVATVDDAPEEFVRALDEHPDVDVVITSGGVSAGAYEVVKNVLGGTIEFTKIAMQPGKPQGFGRLPSGALMFALPGNPVSAAVSFEVFVRPGAARHAGSQQHRPSGHPAPCVAALAPPQGRRQYLPSSDRSKRLRGWSVRPATTGGSGSHLVGGLAVAEAIAVVPAEVDHVSAGDPVDVMLLS